MKLPDMTNPLFDSEEMMMGFGPDEDGKTCVYVVIQADAGIEMMQLTQSLVPGFEDVMSGIQESFGIDQLMGGSNGTD